MNRAQMVLVRFDDAEYRLCCALNRAAAHLWLRCLFRAASRLGDGALWYSMLIVLPLIYGASAIRPVLVMAATGLCGLLVYKGLKSTLVRERPFVRHPSITQEMMPLDRYSFPSGHTLHAVCFTWQAVAHFPSLFWGLVPAAILIALSRVVLGLHYLTDVLAGAAIGAVLATCGLALT